MKKLCAILIPEADGPVPIEVQGEEEPELEWLYRTIGCDIVEAHTWLDPQLGHNVTVWLDENARLRHDVQLNVAATARFGRALLGNVVVTYVA